VAEDEGLGVYAGGAAEAGGEPFEFALEVGLAGFLGGGGRGQGVDPALHDGPDVGGEFVGDVGLDLEGGFVGRVGGRFDHGGDGQGGVPFGEMAGDAAPYFGAAEIGGRADFALDEAVEEPVVEAGEEGWGQFEAGEEGV